MPFPAQCSRPCWPRVTGNGPNSANSSSNVSWSIWWAATLLREWGRRRLSSFLTTDVSQSPWNVFSTAALVSALVFSPLLVFLKDQAASRLIETIIQLSPKSLLRDLYKNHLKGHLVDLALHPIANFPIQRLTAASAKYKVVGPSVGMSHGSPSGFFFIARMIQFSLFSFSSVVLEAVWWADPRSGGHLGRRSHGCDRPAGRELCRERGETGRDDAVPPACKCLLLRRYGHRGLKSIERYPCFFSFLPFFLWLQVCKTAQCNNLTFDLWVMRLLLMCCLPGVPLRWAWLPTCQLSPALHVPARLWGVLPLWHSRGQHTDGGKPHNCGFSYVVHTI